jgi:hypothetical protein
VVSIPIAAAAKPADIATADPVELPEGSKYPGSPDGVSFPVIGKTNMTVINSVYGLSTPNGWSPLYGQTVSPYAPDDTPSGGLTGHTR